ncbi:MAG: ABC transporter permease [Ignavibacteriales bacterium]|nr:MAG: ABC transporter permease [Ignavibacteriales bacterium]
MLRNYLRISLRNLKKEKVSSVINIVGLAVGLTCFITLALFVYDDLSYDKGYNNSENIYRAGLKIVLNGTEAIGSKTAGPLGPTLLKDFPELETYARIGYFGNQIFEYGEKSHREWSIYWVDSTFFDVFSLTFIRGDAKTALTQPNSIVITEKIAQKYFGDENPIGKILVSDQKGGYKVTGVINPFPQNSHFRCEILASIITYPIIDEPIWLESWYSTYIVLKNGTDPKILEEKINKATPEYVGSQVQAALGVSLEEVLNNGNEYRFFLQPFEDIYLYSDEYGIDPNTEWGDVRTSNASYTYAFSAIAVFILLLAVINFMNLATARSERRAKEVGIRKTLGSSKLKLMLQFFIESILMSVIAIIIALALLELTLPSFNRFVGRDLQLNLFSSPYTILLLSGFALLVGVLAGSYPALYLSSFQPIHVLKSGSSTGRRKSYFRNSLVVVQFSVSILMLVGTMVIKNQLDFMQDKNLGFKKDQLVLIHKPGLTGFLQNKIEALKNEFLKNPGVVSVTNSARMFDPGIPGHGYIFNQTTSTEPIPMQVVQADYDFLNTYQIELASGRFFSKEFPSDTLNLLVNEAALIDFGTTDVLGKTLNQIKSYSDAKSYSIIGVVKDFNYETLHKKVRPLVIILNPEVENSGTISVRIRPENMQATISYLESVWDEFTNNEYFNYSFVDEHLASLYEREEKTASITSIFSVLAIFIACLGLFGLAAFVTEQRTKEIGIRKVLGASVPEIIILLSREFALWVLIANIIAWPVAFFVMNNWLEGFAFRINLDITVFLFAGTTALIIALITVSMHAVRAGIANPVESLRNE